MTETTLLQGEITENPGNQDLDVEKLLLGLIRALADEQAAGPSSSRVVPPSVNFAEPVLQRLEAPELATAPVARLSVVASIVDSARERV